MEPKPQLCKGELDSFKLTITKTGTTLQFEAENKGNELFTKELTTGELVVSQTLMLLGLDGIFDYFQKELLSPRNSTRRITINDSAKITLIYDVTVTNRTIQEGFIIQLRKVDESETSQLRRVILSMKDQIECLQAEVKELRKPPKWASTEAKKWDVSVPNTNHDQVVIKEFTQKLTTKKGIIICTFNGHVYTEHIYITVFVDDVPLSVPHVSGSLNFPHYGCFHTNLMGSAKIWIPVSFALMGEVSEGEHVITLRYGGVSEAQINGGILKTVIIEN